MEYFNQFRNLSAKDLLRLGVSVAASGLIVACGTSGAAKATPTPFRSQAERSTAAGIPTPTPVGNPRADVRVIAGPSPISAEVGSVSVLLHPEDVSTEPSHLVANLTGEANIIYDSGAFRRLINNPVLGLTLKDPVQPTWTLFFSESFKNPQADIKRERLFDAFVGRLFAEYKMRTGLDRVMYFRDNISLVDAYLLAQQEIRSGSNPQLNELMQLSRQLSYSWVRTHRSQPLGTDRGNRPLTDQEKAIINQNLPFLIQSLDTSRLIKMIQQPAN